MKIPKKALLIERAANSIEDSEDFNTLLKNNSLEDIPGIGKKISKMIVSLINENQLNYYEKLKNCIPGTVLELVNVGLNVKKIRELYENLKIVSIYDLKNALDQKKITGIKGFSPFFLEKLQKRLERYLIEGNLLLYPKANHIAEILKSKLSKVSMKVEISGALRRKCEVINEINFLVTTDHLEDCRFLFLNHGFVHHILNDSSSFLQVLLKQGINASLQIVEDKDFSLALLKSTGNECHLKDLEAEAYKKQISLTSHSHNFPCESNIYRLLDLNFIPPELREGYGEVEASKKNNFSDLIEEKDLKGTFHCHTIDSDGVNTIEEMVAAAQKMGWQYIGITDHSKSSHQANGLSEERLIAQIQWIRNFNKIIGPSFVVFSGVECDILKGWGIRF